MYLIKALQSQRLSHDLEVAEGVEQSEEKAGFSLAYYVSSPPAFSSGDSVLHWLP